MTTFLPNSSVTHLYHSIAPFHVSFLEDGTLPARVKPVSAHLSHVLVAVTYADLLSGPALLVALLSVVFLVFPCAYLYMALRERGVFRRFFG